MATEQEVQFCCKPAKELKHAPSVAGTSAKPLTRPKLLPDTLGRLSLILSSQNPSLHTHTLYTYKSPSIAPQEATSPVPCVPYL